MKLIISRKGFDAANGGMASPILPDGRLLPLPIPNEHDARTFNDLNVGKTDLGRILSDLSHGKHTLETNIHLDPDLDRAKRLRPRGWRPSLGTTQGHLSKKSIGAGDVFLFFGWFRDVEKINGNWHYVKGALNKHVLFGWLEVADVISTAKIGNKLFSAHPWIADHPHVLSPARFENPRNKIYISTKNSAFTNATKFGGGFFPKYSDELRLTADGSKKRSVWSLPKWFMPKKDREPLSYHKDPARWTANHSQVQLQSVAIGQEFVLDRVQYPEVEGWLKGIIGGHA
jgi:hypothetical protein